MKSILLILSLVGILGIEESKASVLENLQNANLNELSNCDVKFSQKLLVPSSCPEKIRYEDLCFVSISCASIKNEAPDASEVYIHGICGSAIAKNSSCEFDSTTGLLCVRDTSQVKVLTGTDVVPATTGKAPVTVPSPAPEVESVPVVTPSPSPSPTESDEDFVNLELPTNE